MLEIGISTNNECGNSIYEIISNVKNAGFDNIMFAFKQGEVEPVLQKAIDLGLKIPYAHLTHKYAGNLWAKGETNDKFMMEAMKEIKLCAKYNVPIAIMHATSGNASQLALPPNEHGLNCMKMLLTVAAESNVKIALENLDKPNFEHFTYLLDNIDSPWLGLCYDAGHHNLYCPEFDILEEYGHRLLAIHLHDNLMDWEFGYDYTRDLHMLPFDGVIDYEKVCKNLAKVNYKGIVMLEVHKICNGEPRIYNSMSNEQYLQLARQKAILIADKIKDMKKN